MARTTYWVDASVQQASAVQWERAFTERGLRQLLSVLFLPVMVHDGGLIVEVTHGVLFMFGCPSEEIVWNQLADLVTAPCRPILEEHLRFRPGGSVQLEGLRKDGAVFLLEFKGRAALFYQGRGVQVSTLRHLGDAPEGLWTNAVPHSQGWSASMARCSPEGRPLPR